MVPIFRTPDHITEPLYVVTTIFNPVRYKSRWKHYQRFAQHIHDSGAVLYTIELAFGERAHALEEIAPEKDSDKFSKTSEFHHYYRARTKHELWFKEAALNAVIRRLPANWKYLATIDADVMFSRPNWVGETIHQLQHYGALQMFSHAQDLDSNYEVVQTHRSFMDCYLNGAPKETKPKGGAGYYYPVGQRGKPILWHPGFAWAYRRDAFEDLGGLIDFAVLGAGDNHMAHSLIGEGGDSVHPKVHGHYREMVMEWQFRAEKHVRRNVGVMSGTLQHFWHGKKADRRYWDRWKILVDNQYDPRIDIKQDWQGLPQLVDRGTPRSIKLRDDIRTYFRQRNEDALSE